MKMKKNTSHRRRQRTTTQRVHRLSTHSHSSKMIDNLHLLLLIFVVIPIYAFSEPQCKNKDLEYRLLEGESFVSLALLEKYLENKGLTWHNNNVTIESDETERIHCNGTLFFFLNATTKDSGIYTARRVYPSGNCCNYNLNLTVLKVSQRADPEILFGELDLPGLNKRVSCPIPVTTTCKRLGGNLTWYKDFNLLGVHENPMWILNTTKDHEGIYTCICTWSHNHKVYNSSGSRKLIVSEPNIYDDVVEIISPSNEQFADEGSELQLNCTVRCGTNMKKGCFARWQIDGDMDGYEQTETLNIEEPSKATTTTAVLTIKQVSSWDFQTKLKCTGWNIYSIKSVFLQLKRRGSIICLVITAVFGSVLAVWLVKCIFIDIALLFRPCLRPFNRKKDVKFFDAYVVYQTQHMDKEAEDTLGRFVMQILPSVLEDKCGYRLFIQGRDDIPGQDRMELVDNNMKQSRRLIILISPGSGSGSETTDHQSAAAEGFDWQAGLYHALVQREMSVILIQLGDTGTQGYKHLPITLQHLINKSAPLRWPEGSWDAASRNSRFWKKVRYLMPAIPSKKYPQAANEPRIYQNVCEM
ncbi:interleukin-1 receptor-like 1 [Solea senegalensis]|uniref:Interleukin-1 receptor-like 1 n=1 Tax=Solea senegalensis TaxID=28829 RepID=A0AAV6RC49_SOLSE|nr:interleukin-1 receptor-like 1 [Solea senegalensis]